MGGVERRGIPVAFGVSEYTLVFRRSSSRAPYDGEAFSGWAIARPARHVYVMTPARDASATEADIPEGDIPEVLIVGICSTLAMNDAAYERFLRQGGVLARALRAVARVRLANPRSVENTRKRVRSLVMAAEVRHIAHTLSA